MAAVRRGIRAVVPYLFVPLCLVASVLATVPWLRSFPSSVAAVPMYGAAVVSVLVPLVVVRIRPAWLWLSALIDLVAFVAYALLVVVQSPTGFGDLWHGLFQGPSQILTYALPLVSPRTLMVAPVALIWLAGALAGECAARRWYTLLPYLGFLVAFGLAYAATQRASGSPLTATPARESMLAAGLLVTLLLMRVAQAWVRQDETAESTQPDGVLPLRGFVVGIVLAVVIAVLAGFAVQSSAFPKRATTPQRRPSVDQSGPLAPLSFIAGLRPQTPKTAAQPVFTVTTDNTTPGYFAIANVDFYDGAGWSFHRTFRPSGGVLPADTDPALTPRRELTQQYQIAAGPLTNAPWMPFVYRAQKVTGQAVDIDPASGMIVPLGKLNAGSHLHGAVGDDDDNLRQAAGRDRFARHSHADDRHRTTRFASYRPRSGRARPLTRDRTPRQRRRCRSCRRCSATCARTTRSRARRAVWLPRRCRRRRHRRPLPRSRQQDESQDEPHVHTVDQLERRRARLRRRDRLRRRPRLDPRSESARHARAVRDVAGTDRSRSRRPRASRHRLPGAAVARGGRPCTRQLQRDDRRRLDVDRSAAERRGVGRARRFADSLRGRHHSDRVRRDAAADQFGTAEPERARDRRQDRRRPRGRAAGARSRKRSRRQLMRC